MKKYHIFKSPYLLVEDIKQHHKPFYKEYTGSIPTLNMDSKPLNCPFSNKRFVQGKRKKIKEGFCETCYVSFEDYSKHILEAEHREYARDDANYESVDNIINEYISSDILESPCTKYQSTIEMSEIAVDEMRSSDFFEVSEIGKGIDKMFGDES